MKFFKTNTKLPKMLVIGSIRGSNIDFYNFFTRFNIDYVPAINPGYEIDVSIFSKQLKLLHLKSCPTYFFDPVTFIQRSVNNLSLLNIKGLEEYVKNTDIVNITDTYYCYNAQTVMLAKKYNKPIVTTIWATIPNHISSWIFPYSWNTKKVIAATDLFILRSRTAYRFTDSLGINRKKTVVIYNGINLKHFSPSIERNSIKLTILYVGNYHKSKGLVDLICVFERLVNEGLPVRLMTAGNGQLKSYIANKAKKLPITDCGFQNYQGLADVYRKADIFCSPSVYQYLLGVRTWEEYFSYTLMEAQASGLAIVSTRSGGIPEEVSCDNPLVAPGNRKDLYFALKDLLINKKKRELIAKKNRKRAKSLFNAQIQAKRTEKELLALLS
jgi:glycosyltransferase involved in cell wall biosynthesis